MKQYGNLLFLLSALFLAGGCATTPPPGLDRAEACARAAVLERFPEDKPENLRLKQIERMDRNTLAGRTYRVEFEDVSTIHVGSQSGIRSRSVRYVQVQVAPNGLVTSVTESSPSSVRKAKP